jgi:CBS domain-containing protein
MKIKDIMTGDIATCDLNASLTYAAKEMWDHDCGVLPVLKDGKEVVGIITDRDICMGAAMKNRSPSDISVEEVITGRVYTVGEEDDLQLALDVMQQHKVRRLPVLSAEGDLKGILSIDDVVRNATEQTGESDLDLGYAEVMQTYKAICDHTQPM